MSKTYKFRVHGLKKNGDERDKTFEKINHALRFLWRIKEAQEIYLDAVEFRDDGTIGGQWHLFVKMGRQRGINSNHAIVPDGRPTMKKAGAPWRRLPSKWNDLE
ncbi:MAG: hypothetical protein ACXABY_30815 [Candidatus Thorarchaeota archaeon]|jgi:hypothetical protein